jgi:hypothetical protein
MRHGLTSFASNARGRRPLEFLLNRCRRDHQSMAFAHLESLQDERRGEPTMIGVINYRLTDAVEPVPVPIRGRQS